MKITFDNSFEALKPRINAPLNGAEQNSNFGSLLKDISPFATQDSKNITNLGPPKRSLDTDVGPMASYKFAPPSMILTESSRITDGQNGVSLEDGSVKSPTLLEAKRVRSKNAYKGLTQEERGEEVKKLASAYGYKYGIDPSLALAVAQAESSFDPKAVSTDGHASKGLFQLLDGTGKELLEKLSPDKEYEPFNPEQNSELGISYLRYLHDIFNSKSDLTKNKETTPAANSASLEKLAVAAFNAGQGRVASAQNAAKNAGLNPGEYTHIEAYLPESTQNYVKKVDEIKARYAVSETEIEGS